MHRALTIAYDLIEHNVVFLCDSAHREGIEKLQASNMPVVEFESRATLFAWLEDNKPDVL